MASSKNYPFKTEGKQNRDFFMSFHSFNLSDIKAIRRKVGCNFISIALSCMGGVTRKLFLETSSEEQLPEYICVQIPLPWPNHPRDKLCNHLYGTTNYFKF